MFKHFADIQESLQSNKTELEIRKIIQKPRDFNPTIINKIDYYSSNIYNNVVFRKYNDGIIVHTKEIIMKNKTKNGITIVLSAEDKYHPLDIKGELKYLYTRIIKRESRNEEGLKIDITECNSEYQLEIEFDINTYHLLPKYLKKWKYPFWPAEKPKEVNSKQLARVLNNKDWIITPKADGEHIMIYENKEKEQMIIHDNGNIIENNFDLKQVYSIYEGELINDIIYYFDCYMFEGKKINNLPYKERHKYIPYLKKEIYDYEGKISDNLNKTDYPIDGYILKHNTNNKTYKSKFNTTVDFKFMNNQLLLEYETFSNREYFGLQNNSIYEFDLNYNLIKERKDKTKANTSIPLESQVLENIINGIGIPHLRNFHNNIKNILLEKLKNKNLLDIGSGKGGDINKWIKNGFKKVYAVDPNLNLYSTKPFIKEIRDNVENVYENLDYNAVSILFVPWNEKFLDIIKNKECILIILQKPKTYIGKSFKCEFDGTNINLEIPKTSTAININEKYHDLSFLKKYEINFTLRKGTEEEKILQKMYKYYYIPIQNS